jgi:hypothetical protein
MSALEDLRTLQRKWDAEGWPEVPQPEGTALGFTDLLGIILTGCVLALIPFIIITVGAIL